MSKPATIFTASADGDFTQGELCRRETQADVEARQARWERTKINVAMLALGFFGMAALCAVALLAYGTR